MKNPLALPPLPPLTITVGERQIYSGRQMQAYAEQARHELIESMVPIAWQADWPTWRQYHDDQDPFPDEWDAEPPTMIALYELPVLKP
jgi:hypothetical protein